MELRRKRMKEIGILRRCRQRQKKGSILRRCRQRQKEGSILRRCRKWQKVQDADVLLCCLLFGLSLFFCWFEIGRFGIFGSSVDWISQHSVIPDYFRQQFYATGDLFPEFAPGLGGGQNIYNFAYYGLYNPLLLFSYLLPSVRMGDYLMAVSELAAAASAVTFYGWLRSRKNGCGEHDFSRGISFWTSVLFILSGPLIFHSARQVMFVNYMPFLCMALWGVDRFFRRGKSGVYLLGVFLMIMTSFYYSVGGMLVLVIYGSHRYFRYREHPEEIPAGSSFFRNKMRDGIRFLFPMLEDVLLSAFFLFPTAAALAGKRGGSMTAGAAQLLLPKLSLFPHLYSSYGVGLTAFLITVLISGLFWRGTGSRILIGSSLAVLVFPVFMWLLNGGLYVREKALIPFLPLFCYVTACYCARVERADSFVRMGRANREDGAASGKGVFLRNISTGSIPYIAAFFLLYLESGLSAKEFFLRSVQLPAKLQNGTYLALADRWTLVLLDALLMPVWYLLCRKIRRMRGRERKSGLLLVLPVLFLALFGQSFRNTVSVESREFYEQVNQKDIGKAIQRVLAMDDGFYRVEQMGSGTEQAADINRIWNAGQYISSIYSSAYNSAYQEFRMNTFDVEEPEGNFMMQRVSTNPVFQKLMGVRYLVKAWEKPEMAADRGNSPFGYEWYLQEGCVAVYKNQNTAPICYATDRLISREAYEALEFPLNQTILEKYAVIEEKGGTGLTENEAGQIVERGTVKAGANEIAETGTAKAGAEKITKVELALPETESKCGKIEKTETGYRIKADKTWKIQAQLTGVEGNGRPESADAKQVLYLQFHIKNLKPGNSISIWVNDIKNTLSPASSGYFYYNNNTTFTYAVPMTGTLKELSVTFGKGSVEITDICAFTGSMDKEGKLYQSEFIPDRMKTKGDRISGEITVQNNGYFVTSIPYDESFEVKVDGRKYPAETVNTAFLGFPIREGRHSVEIIYHAPGATVGRIVSLLGALLIVGRCVRRRKGKMKKYSVR